jgi:hypothetical protein
VSGQLHAPATISPRYPLDRRLGGPQSRCGRFGDNSWRYRDSNSDPSFVQPVASRYTDYATPAPNNNNNKEVSGSKSRPAAEKSPRTSTCNQTYSLSLQLGIMPQAPFITSFWFPKKVENNHNPVSSEAIWRQDERTPTHRWIFAIKLVSGWGQRRRAEARCLNDTKAAASRTRSHWNQKTVNLSLQGVCLINEPNSEATCALTE